MTIHKLLESAQKRLYAAGYEDAASTVRILSEELLRLSTARLLAERDREATAAEQELVENTLVRLLDHEPLQYILGKAWFMDLELLVNENVLIPRPETELLAEWILDEHPDGPLRFLDLCTGSGCLLLSIAAHRSHFQGVGTDLSLGALAVARENARRLQLTDQVEFRQGDLWEAVPEGESFDFIVCNPPYITQKDMQELAENVKKEP